MKNLLANSIIVLIVCFGAFPKLYSQLKMCKEHAIGVRLDQNNPTHVLIIEDVLHNEFIRSGDPITFQNNFSTFQLSYTDNFPVAYTITEDKTNNTCSGTIINRIEDPTAIANPSSETTFYLDQNGQVIIRANDLPKHSYDIKTPSKDLLYYFNGSQSEIIVSIHDFIATKAKNTLVISTELTVIDEDNHRDSSRLNLIIHKGNYVYSNIIGKVYFDQNSNCTYDQEVGMPQRLIKISNGITDTTTLTDNNGNFAIILKSGIYSITSLNNSLLFLNCNHTYNLEILNDTIIDSLYFGHKPGLVCEDLKVSLSLPVLRPCLERLISLNIQNQGSGIAQDVQLFFEKHDKIQIINSDHPLQILSNNEFIAFIGDLEPFQSKKITIRVKPDCDSEIGSEVCFKAHVSCSNPCNSSSIQASGIQIEGKCQGDSIRFVIINSSENDMASSNTFSIVEDDIIIFMKQYKLNKLDSIVKTIPAKGKTYHLISSFIKNNESVGIRANLVQTCGQNSQGPNSSGYIDLFNYNDNSLKSTIECETIRNSCDPNEKQANPIGYRSDHKIYPNTKIKYTIHFQNIGNDTAYYVVIEDKISEFLDPLSIIPLESSHEYDYNILSDGTLKFYFFNIDLVDSTHNEPESHGFVSFIIDQKKDLAPMSRIENSASIIFDLNSPIITNTVFHTVDTNFIEIVTLNYNPTQTKEIIISPNPSRDYVKIKFDHYNSSGKIIIYNLQGEIIMEKENLYSEFEMATHNFQSGTYIFNIITQNKISHSGRLVKI